MEEQLSSPFVASGSVRSPEGNGVFLASSHTCFQSSARASAASKKKQAQKRKDAQKKGMAPLRIFVLFEVTGYRPGSSLTFGFVLAPRLARA